MASKAQMPRGWRLVRLGDVAEINPRRPPLSVPAETPVTLLADGSYRGKFAGNCGPGISTLFRGFHRVHLL